MMKRLAWLLSLLAMLLGFTGCGDEAAVEEEANPFLENQDNLTKADSQYMNPDGIEVEVDLEADVSADSYRIADAPAMLGQFGLTYLRKQGDFYLESLAEDATSRNRVEWLVEGTWITAEQAKSLPASKLTHFRIRGINAVLLHSAVGDATLGKVFEVDVPKVPYSIMSDAGDKCADKDGHISLSQSVYWYMWNPDRSGCPKELLQKMTVTLSKLLPTDKTTYPEYDQLVADGKVTAVVLFGQIGEGDIETDSGMYGFKRMGTWLKNAGFKEVADAPVGKRYAKKIADVSFEIDLYSPKDFSGLSDHGNYNNFERAVTEHEIVVYDGHSMLGASDFWARPEYPDFYQIFVYGGCLGYEYYVRPILAGKGGWDKVDIISSVVEVSAGAQDFAGPFLSKMAWALDHGYKASWRDMLVAIRSAVGDSTFGICGARENCFSPAGSLCVDEPADPEAVSRFENTSSKAIPDNKATGISSKLSVAEDFTIKSLALELNIAHSYVADLTITLTHDGKTVAVWEQVSNPSPDLRQTFGLADFVGESSKGTWTLKVKDTAADDKGTLESWALVMTK